jgi:hypothetical protein
VVRAQSASASRAAIQPQARKAHTRSAKRSLIENLHDLGFIDRKENVVLLEASRRRGSGRLVPAMSRRF